MAPAKLGSEPGSGPVYGRERPPSNRVQNTFSRIGGGSLTPQCTCRSVIDERRGRRNAPSARRRRNDKSSQTVGLHAFVFPYIKCFGRSSTSGRAREGGQYDPTALSALLSAARRFSWAWQPRERGEIVARRDAPERSHPIRSRDRGENAERCFACLPGFRGMAWEINVRRSTRHARVRFR